MTNVGDFDGKTTWGSKGAGGDGEHLVRVGTENRQHVLGHISLLGYSGKIIAPMTTGGPDESALGDPIEILLNRVGQTMQTTRWAGRFTPLSSTRRTRSLYRWWRCGRAGDDSLGVISMEASIRTRFQIGTDI